MLPSIAQRYAWLGQFEAKLKQARYFEEKYHYLGDGDDQWEYCRFLARESGLIGEDRDAEGDGGGGDCADNRRSSRRATAESVDSYLRLIQEIYNDNIAHRPAYPGALDCYRERRYRVNW